MHSSRARVLLVLALALLVPGLTFARSHSPRSSNAKAYSGHNNKDKTVRVDPYRRKDGTWVRGHYKHESGTAPIKGRSRRK